MGLGHLSIAPPLIEIRGYCESLGYDVIPVKELGGWRVNLWKEDRILKEGKKLWTDWREGEKDAYKQLFNVLSLAKQRNIS